MSPDTDAEAEVIRQGNESNVYARFRLPPLTLTLFEVDTENGVFYDAQLQRAYTEDDGETFQYTDSIRQRDMRKAGRLFTLAADHVEGFSLQRPEATSED